jgi:hypothetical protein
MDLERFAGGRGRIAKARKSEKKRKGKAFCDLDA